MGHGQRETRCRIRADPYQPVSNSEIRLSVLLLESAPDRALSLKHQPGRANAGRADANPAPPVRDGASGGLQTTSPSWRISVGSPPGGSRAFNEGTVAFEPQSFVDVDRTHIVLTDVEDHIADPTL